MVSSVTNLPIRDWNSHYCHHSTRKPYVTNLPIRDWNALVSIEVVLWVSYEPSYKGLKPLLPPLLLLLLVTNLPIRDWNRYWTFWTWHFEVTNLPIRDWNNDSIEEPFNIFGYEPSYKGLKPASSDSFWSSLCYEPSYKGLKPRTRLPTGSLPALRTFL